MKISLIVQFHNGVGHLARVSAISRELSRFAEVTIFSGGRPVDFRLSESVSFVQLPAMRWSAEAGARLEPVDAGLSVDECLRERSRILVESYRNSRPDVIVTEFFPFTPGFYGTTLNELINEINNSNPRPLLFCSIRAFPRVTLLDSDVSPDWIRSRLLEDYKAVFHHVDPAIFPLASLGSYVNAALRGIQVYQTGFVRKQVVSMPRGARTGILMTVGGGNAKSAVLLKKWIESVSFLSKKLFPIHAVCGPLMSPEDRAMLRKSALKGVVVHDSVPDLDTLLQQCRAVVCMGGYNTLIEALSLQKPVLSFASGTHEDQHIQISRYSERGLLMKGDPSWPPQKIAQAIDTLADFSPDHTLLTDGAAKTAEIIKNLWLEARENSCNLVT